MAFRRSSRTRGRFSRSRVRRRVSRNSVRRRASSRGSARTIRIVVEQPQPQAIAGLTADGFAIPAQPRRARF